MYTLPTVKREVGSIQPLIPLEILLQRLPQVRALTASWQRHVPCIRCLSASVPNDTAYLPALNPDPNSQSLDVLIRLLFAAP